MLWQTQRVVLGKAWAALGAALLLILVWPALAAAAGAAPALVGSVSDPSALSSTTSVAVSGSYAYTTAYQAGTLTAVNISNPASPTIAGQSAQDAHLFGGSNVAIAGGYAFVVSKNRNASTSSNDDGTGNSLTILDIHTNPAVPAIVGTVRDTGKLFGSYGIAVSGNDAYVAYQGVLSGQPSTPDTSTGGFSVIDISSPGAPAIVGNIDNASLGGANTNALEHATSVAISGQYAYVTAFYAHRVTVVDISNPASPTIVASLSDTTNLSYPVDLAVQGNDLYVANQVSGTANQFAIVDISTPTSPRVVSALSDNTDLAGAYRIRVRGNFAYESASSADAVAAIDVSDPLHPRVAGSVIDDGHLHRTTGLDLDATGAYVIASSPYLSSESNATYPPFPTTTGTISSIRLDPNPIGVTIAAASEPASSTTQTSASFSFAATDAVSVLRCQLDGGAFAPCSTPTTEQYGGLPAGTHTFTVQATDATGQTATDAYRWQVVTSTTNTPPPVAPKVTVVRVTPSRWAEKRAPHSHKAPGTKLTFTLSEAAHVSLTFTHTVAGWKRSGRCVSSGKKPRSAHHCTRIITDGTISLSGHKGANTVTFTGRLHGRLLKLGRYAVTIQATAQGVKSRPVKLTFVIVAAAH